MNEAEFKSLVARQRVFFNSGKTLDYKFRIATLRHLKETDNKQ